MQHMRGRADPDESPGIAPHFHLKSVEGGRAVGPSRQPSTLVATTVHQAAQNDQGVWGGLASTRADAFNYGQWGRGACAGRLTRVRHVMILQQEILMLRLPC